MERRCPRPSHPDRRREPTLAIESLGRDPIAGTLPIIRKARLDLRKPPALCLKLARESELIALARLVRGKASPGIGEALTIALAFGIEIPEPMLEAGNSAKPRHRQEFAHREHVATHPERRQDLAHIVLLGRADLEPLAPIKDAGIIIETVRPLSMPVEHPEHLAPVGDALIDFADWRMGHGRAHIAAATRADVGTECHCEFGAFPPAVLRRRPIAALGKPLHQTSRK